MGIEPMSSAWKAEVLPLNYTRLSNSAVNHPVLKVVEGGGFEPPKAEPSDLQSDPFSRSGTPPRAQSHARSAGGGIVVIPLPPVKGAVFDDWRRETWG
ncbi:hypothetical protein CCP3SC1_850002 [Gammaproteobacteria bacterium]